MSDAKDRSESGPEETRRAGEGLAAPLPGTSHRRWDLGAALRAFHLVALFMMVPFLSLSTSWKVGVAAVLVTVGEAAFWMAAPVLGRGVVHRYRRFLDPRRWLGKKRWL